MSDPVIHVLVEIPAQSNIKYELDEKTGRIYVDRFVPTPMLYPTNYCSVEGARGKDGDLLDALLLTMRPVAPGVWMKARVIGMLEMEDEEGIDHKIICVPEKIKQDVEYGGYQDITDVPQYLLDRIKHFFEHYKDLEKDKWVKIKQFVNKAAALKELAEAQAKMK